MTPEAYRAARDRLGLGNGQICRLMGVDRRTGQRWEAGEREVAPPAERLLWLMERVPGVIDALHAFDTHPAARTYHVDGREDGAWRLRLLDGGRDMGGGVFPAEQRAFAVQAGEEWLDAG